MRVEQPARRVPRTARAEPFLRRAAWCEADHFPPPEKGHISSADRPISEAQPENPDDITLHHRRLRIHPERIHKDKDIDSGEESALFENIPAWGEAARLGQFVCIERGREIHAVE